jgi:hypothetical protein
MTSVMVCSVADRLSASASRSPVRYHQTRHALEFASVQGDEDSAASPCLRGDQDIVGTDWNAVSFQRRLDLTRFAGVAFVKIDDFGDGGQEVVDPGMIACGIPAFLGAVRSSNRTGAGTAR